MYKYFVIFLLSSFLVANIALRLYALHSQGVVLKLLLPVLAAGFVVAYGRSGILRILFFLLGLSLPLFGYQSYTFINNIFEFIIIVLSCLLLLLADNHTRRPQDTGVISRYLGCYVLLVVFSLFLLPLSSFGETISLWGLFDFSNALLFATPENPLYSLAAVNRLLMFIIFVALLNNNRRADKLYHMLFLGCACSVLIACLLGLLNHYGFISLVRYRPEFFDLSGVDRLHSIFGNPGWFAKYVVVCTPFVLLLLKKEKCGRIAIFVFFLVCIVIGWSLLLTGSRTSWLIFPIVVFYCFIMILLVYRETDQPIAWWEALQSCKRVGLASLVVCLLVGSIVMVAVQENSSRDHRESNLSQQHYLTQRFRDIIKPTVYSQLWRESIVMVGESPWFGMGYEGYGWHQQVLSSVSSSSFLQKRETDNNWDTAHNHYIQLVAGNGIVGLVIWLVLIGYVALLLYRDAQKKRAAQSFMLLLALISFHLYGFTQSMQYIASIYFLIFLIIGYAMRLESTMQLPMTKGKLGRTAVLVTVVLGGLVYATNLQSHKLAERYGLPRYGIDRDADQYQGFYQMEDWGKDGFFRWSGRKAVIVLKESGMVQFEFACYAPRLEQLPLTLEVILDGQSIDRYTFRLGQKVTRTYFIAERRDNLPRTLLFKSSRIWNPNREKLNTDTRNLGVAVSEPRYIVSLPALPVLLIE